MEKKKLVTLLIQIAIFTVFLAILFNADAKVNVGIILLVLGLILLRFKKAIAEQLYKRQIEVIKRRSSIEKFVEDVNHCGIFATVVGIISLFLGLVFR